MADKMTLEQVRDEIRNMGVKPGNCYNRWADAIEPYLAWPHTVPVTRVLITEAMVERGAQAISQRNLSNTGVPFPIEACRADARAAIEAALAAQESQSNG